jgi:hypothetical protein
MPFYQGFIHILLGKGRLDKGLGNFRVPLHHCIHLEGCPDYVWTVYWVEISSRDIGEKVQGKVM